jgi:hypothetical protein
VAPSDRIVMAGIGFGMQGPSNMRSFLGHDDVQWVAVCDLDDVPLNKARDTVNEKYGDTDCVTYKDYRQLFARGHPRDEGTGAREDDAVEQSIPALSAGG